MSQFSTILSILPAIEQLSSRVIRILGCNPGPFTLQGTNTYLIGNGKKRILLDSGEEANSQYIQNLDNILKSNGATIKEVVITHWHRDHIGGIWDVSKMLNKDKPLAIKKFQRISEPESYPNGDFEFTFLEHGASITVEGATLKALYTPGHTDDHMSVLLEEENALFSGDCILGEGSCVFEDLHDYMKSLEFIKSLEPHVIYPGHGPVIKNPAQHIDSYVENRNRRECQIIDAISDNAAKSTLEIVEKVYVEIPKSLYKAAEGNVILHLGKLLKEGRVEKVVEGDNIRWKMLDRI